MNQNAVKIIKPVVLLLIVYVVCIKIGNFIYEKTRPEPLISPLSEVQPTPTPSVLRWNDEIRALFPEDKSGTMIRICIAETLGRNGKYATHWEDDGTYSYGWCQINSVHRPARMNDFEWREYLEDPKNHALETYRIYSEQGFNAWFNSYQKVK